MTNRLIPVALGLALLAPAASAQVSGSINRDAPSVTHSIEFANGNKMSVSFKAIHFGQGAWLKRWEANKDDEQFVERFNQSAANSPVGSVHTTVACSVAGREVPAGKYDLFFTVNARAGFILNLKSQDDEDAEAIRWRLATKEADQKRTRLYVGLTAGDKATDAVVTIAFGNMHVTVPVTTSKAKAGGQKQGG